MFFLCSCVMCSDIADLDLLGSDVAAYCFVCVVSLLSLSLIHCLNSLFGLNSLFDVFIVYVSVTY